MGTVDNGNDQQLVPGRVLLRNINLGSDPNDLRFQILKNVDSGLEFRCRKDFVGTPFMVNFNSNPNPIPLFFGLSEQNPDLFYPAIFSFAEDYAFLSQPPFVGGVFPGGAVPCLTISPRHNLKWEDMCLRRLEILHNETIMLDTNGGQFEKNNYEIMVHCSKDLSSVELEKPCLALVYRLSRHFKGTKPQRYKHLDASLLDFYMDSELYQRNLSELAYLKERYNENWVFIGSKKEFWFDNIDKLPDDLFDRLTFQVHLSKKSVEQATINLPKVQVISGQASCVYPSLNKWKIIHL